MHIAKPHNSLARALLGHYPTPPSSSFTLGLAARRRPLCTTPPPPSTFASSIGPNARALFNWLRHNKVLVGVGAGALLVMYGFYRASMRVMRFFINVPPHEIFSFGMFVGALTSVVALAGFNLGRRRVTTSVPGIINAAVVQMRAHPQVEEALGELWRPQRFRGYAFESMHAAAVGSDRRARSTFLEFPAPRVQVIFPVKGLEHTGLVSVEAYKRHGEYIFSMLELDVPATGTHVQIAGEQVDLFPEVLSVLQGAKDLHARRKG